MKPMAMQMSVVKSRFIAPSRPRPPLFRFTEIAIARMGPIIGEMSMLATMVAALSIARPTAEMTAAITLHTYAAYQY